jgi:hypothetical protein
MRSAFSILPVIAIGLVATVGPAMPQGRPPGSGQGLEAKQSECRLQANRKGLVGPAHRADRQAFMQKCVHGAN